jgi:hypothetical protein
VTATSNKLKMYTYCKNFDTFTATCPPDNMKSFTKISRLKKE